jgi:hypothetical protein
MLSGSAIIHDPGYLKVMPRRGETGEIVTERKKKVTSAVSCESMKWLKWPPSKTPLQALSCQDLGL